MNYVGQVVQMDGYHVTTCLIVGQTASWAEDTFDWILIVLDEAGPPPYDILKHRELQLGNSYVAKYAKEVT